MTVSEKLQTLLDDQDFVNKLDSYEPESAEAMLKEQGVYDEFQAFALELLPKELLDEELDEVAGGRQCGLFGRSQCNWICNGCGHRTNSRRGMIAHQLTRSRCRNLGWRQASGF